MSTGKTQHIAGAILAGVVLALSACSSLPERVDTLEQARTQIRSLESDPLAQEAAAVELSQARQAVASADRAYENDRDLEIVEHYAYVANRHAQIAEQQIAEARASQQLARSEAERNEVLLEAREREAERAQRLAEQRGRAAQIQASRATVAERQAAQAQRRAEALARDLQNMQARQTDRGMVLTLSDILFDTDRASLKPGAARTLNELAAFLNDYPDRAVLIEGHTDARGPASYNVELSERRAQAVEDALLERGVAADRIRTVGLGEEYPLASNQTTAGMQQNRRVEIVLSDADGNFPAAADERVASLTERDSA